MAKSPPAHKHTCVDMGSEAWGKKGKVRESNRVFRIEKRGFFILILVALLSLYIYIHMTCYVEPKWYGMWTNNENGHRDDDDVSKQNRIYSICNLALIRVRIDDSIFSCHCSTIYDIYISYIHAAITYNQLFIFRAWQLHFLCQTWPSSDAAIVYNHKWRRCCLYCVSCKLSSFIGSCYYRNFINNNN